MTVKVSLESVRSELQAGIALAKCRQCGCMHDGLDNISVALPSVGTEDADTLARDIVAWREEMRPTRYACLGCDYCYPAVAQNVFAQAFPAIDLTAELSCDFRVVDTTWPPVVGEYVVLDQDAPVAVSTLASAQLAEELAQRKPSGLSIVGKTETENIGIDKVIKNVVANPRLRYLIVAGTESDGHYVGQTMLALARNGVDAHGRVIGSIGKRPVLRNVLTNEIDTFREQVQLIDMRGCEDIERLVITVETAASQIAPPCGCGECGEETPPSIASISATVAAESPTEVALDKAGYFVILPLRDQGLINVEHYAYDHRLLNVVEGKTARDIYRLIIERGWVTELSHAAYLGKELGKAELSLQLGFKYLQDGA